MKHTTTDWKGKVFFNNQNSSLGELRMNVGGETITFGEPTIDKDEETTCMICETIRTQYSGDVNGRTIKQIKSINEKYDHTLSPGCIVRRDIDAHPFINTDNFD